MDCELDIFEERISRLERLVLGQNINEKDDIEVIYFHLINPFNSLLF